MKKVEEEIIVRGHGIADMQKSELDKYIEKICEIFTSDGAIEWEGEPIFTKALLLDHIEKFNQNRLDYGYTSLTTTDIANIKEKLFEPQSVVPTNEIELLDKAIEMAYDRMAEELAKLKIQMDHLKKKIITLSEDYTETTKK